MMNLEGVELREPKLDELHAADKWILSRVNTLAKDATENMDKFELESQYKGIRLHPGTSSVTGISRCKGSYLQEG